ncbi:hypothetical protein KSP39_PZI000475 [Platanthera zijinensis]|uniref:Uncharacterized protein n=1 Tax=Platanthera zijinensis TaxID=2320716 RepID=A0AAP0C251_9ASPA
MVHVGKNFPTCNHLHPRSSIPPSPNQADLQLDPQKWLNSRILSPKCSKRVCFTPSESKSARQNDRRAHLLLPRVNFFSPLTHQSIFPTATIPSLPFEISTALGESPCFSAAGSANTV